ncbi:hypothetical protein BZL30_6103 [Mycobacterium kansasii]|uniref:Uncharacterized protein n=1 Tax=Mycobacterium kansasii TaxID=1768 RepID=A0A1V3WTU5_MYCKA|nr:hypothetical protein BZL30_6103 [Mycobacterium kansasii]
MPRRGNDTSLMSAPLQRGHHCCTGKVVAPQSPQQLPISCGLSFGQVEMSGARAFCIAQSFVVGRRIIRFTEQYNSIQTEWKYHSRHLRSAGPTAADGGLRALRYLLQIALPTKLNSM